MKQCPAPGSTFSGHNLQTVHAAQDEGQRIEVSRGFGVDVALMTEEPAPSD